MFYSLPWSEYIPPLWYHLGLIVLYLSILILCTETLNRFTPIGAELTRKIVHIGSGNVILLAWWLNIPSSIIVAAAAIASIAALLSYFIPILPSINSVGRKSLGTFFYAISIGILVVSFWSEQPQYTVIGILIMAWGDGLAAVIGQNFGKHPYSFLGSQKSWEGSLTMVVVSYLVSSLIFLAVQGNSWETWIISLIVAITATSLETLSQLGLDNLTVPLGSAALAYFLAEIIF